MTAGRCADCGGALVPIRYGYPGPELISAEARGEVLLGGCAMDLCQPEAGCTACWAHADVFSTD